MVNCERVEDPNIFGFPFVWVGMPRWRWQGDGVMVAGGWQVDGRWMAGGAFMTTL